MKSVCSQDIGDQGGWGIFHNQLQRSVEILNKVRKVLNQSSSVEKAILGNQLLIVLHSFYISFSKQRIVLRKDAPNDQVLKKYVRNLGILIAKGRPGSLRDILSVPRYASFRIEQKKDKTKLVKSSTKCCSTSDKYNAVNF